MQSLKSTRHLNACAECSNAAADHWFIWVSSTLELGISSFGSLTFFSKLYSAASRGFAYSIAPILPLLFRGAEVFRIVSRNDDLSRVCTKRSRVVWEEARRRNIPLKQLFVFGIPTEFFEAHIHGTLRIFYSLPIPPQYRTGALWADDKYLLKKRLNAAHIAAPVSYSVSTLRAAEVVLQELGIVCVKPRAGSNGYHTFPFVSTKAELAAAFRSAKKLCYWVTVEQHIEGNVCRATCVNGRLIGFLESEYPTVVGDGRSSVAELIKEANRTKPERVADIELTPLHQHYIGRRGYTRESILKEGEKLPLIYWAGYSSGGRSTEHGTQVHPELHKEIERAARLTGIPVVGFDLIVPDPQKDPKLQSWGIIEANSLPWIDLHSAPLWGTPVNVAAYIWDLWKTETA